MRELTRAHAGQNAADPSQVRYLAVVSNGRVMTAPAIRSEIGAEVQLTGNLTNEEIDDLCAVLRAGVLPCPLRLVDERYVNEAKSGSAPVNRPPTPDTGSAP